MLCAVMLTGLVQDFKPMNHVLIVLCLPCTLNWRALSSQVFRVRQAPSIFVAQGDSAAYPSSASSILQYSNVASKTAWRFLCWATCQQEKAHWSTWPLQSWFQWPPHSRKQGSSWICGIQMLDPFEGYGIPHHQHWDKCHYLDVPSCPQKWSETM